MAVRIEADRILDALQHTGVRWMMPVLIEYSGFIYGSWALRHQQDSLRRLPKDIDVGFDLARTQVPAIVNAIDCAFGHRLWGCERVKFSDDSRSPVVLRVGTSVSWRGIDGDVLFGVAFVPSHPADRLISVDIGGGSPLQMLRWETCLAQKYVRLSLRRSGDRRHTRWQDLMDMWDVGATLDMPGRIGWKDAIRDEARRRGLSDALWLPSPPAEWTDFWDEKCFEDQVARPSPHIAVAAINDWLQAVQYTRAQ